MRDRMRIALINHWPPNTGVGTYIFSLLSNLRLYENVKTDMFCLGFDPKRIRDIDKKVAKSVHFLHKPSVCRNRHFASMFKHFIATNRIPKLYHLYHVSDEMIARFAKSNSPSVITNHGPLTFTAPEDTIAFGTGRLGPTYSFYNIFLKNIYRNIEHASKIICISEFSKRNLLATLPITHKKTKVIYYGLDHKLFKPRDKRECRKRIGLPSNKKIVLNVGNESCSKNIPTLIKAFHRVNENISDVVLVRVGDQLPITKKLVDDLNLKDYHHFKRVPHIDIAYFYNSADLFVFPSFYEGFGFPVLEAMASGCPVIAGNRTAVPEIAGDAALLIDPFDIDSLAVQMETVLENEDLRNRLIEKGIKRASDFSWQKCARETMKTYQEVLE